MNKCRHCKVSNRTYLQTIKRFRLPNKDLEKYKSRIHIIPNELDVLIYWYRNKKNNNKNSNNNNNKNLITNNESINNNKNSNNNNNNHSINNNIYLGSDAQIEKLCKHFSNPDYVLPDYILEVIWKCGSHTEKISQPYINFNASAGYGYTYLFDEQILNKNNRRIKITVKFYKKVKETNKLNAKMMKQKNMKQLTLKDCYKKKIRIAPNNHHSSIFINHLFNHNKYNKTVEYFSEARIPSNQLDDVLQELADKLCVTDLFELCPTIDCFATSDNYQRICKEYITKDMDFFSSDYDVFDYWTKHIAWLFPPLNRKKIQLCYNKLKSRKMKGFLCIPYLPHSFPIYSKLKILSVEYIQMNGRDKHNDIFIANKSEINRCTFDIIVYYFNFQKCAVCPSHAQNHV